MTSLPIGILSFFAVLLFALAGTSREVFLNLHSIVLVVGGTVCVLIFSNPWTDLKEIWTSLVELLTQREPPMDEINRHLVAIAKNREAKAQGYVHPLVLYAQSLWEQGVEQDIFPVLLNQKLEQAYHASEEAIAAMRALAKYPPALGMTGTVIGLVTLFSHLTPNSQLNLGPSLALAMTATFYGLVLANGVLMPLADRLYVHHLTHLKTTDHVFKTLLLIHRGALGSMLEDSFANAA